MGMLPTEFDPNKSTSDYMKFQPGDNKFRILGQGVAGFEWWKEEDGKKKPVRKHLTERIDPEEIPLSQKPRQFVALPVWNYATEKVEVLHITQKNVQKTISSLESDPDWGDLSGYDVKVTKTGSGMETKYSAAPAPKKELSKEITAAWEKTKLNLEALFTGESPFGDF